MGIEMEKQRKSNPYDTPYWIYLIISILFVASLLLLSHSTSILYEDLRGFVNGGEMLIIYLLYKAVEQQRINRKN
jgi:hypothetical protein